MQSWWLWSFGVSNLVKYCIKCDVIGHGDVITTAITTIMIIANPSLYEGAEQQNIGSGACNTHTQARKIQYHFAVATYSLDQHTV